jgi:ABC-type nitrate/sulfonate/bicarbonate transport system permease component
MIEYDITTTVAFLALGIAVGFPLGVLMGLRRLARVRKTALELLSNSARY